MVVRWRIPKTISLSYRNPTASFAQSAKNRPQRFIDSNGDNGSLFSDSASLLALHSKGETSQQLNRDRATAVPSHTTCQRHVLRFQEAIFGDTSCTMRAKPVGELKAINATDVDGHNMKPSDLNALQARSEYQGNVPELKSMIHFMVSVVENPSAVKQRLLALTSMASEIGRSPDFCLSAFRNISAYLSAAPNTQRDSRHARDWEKRWLEVLTGWSGSEVGKRSEKRAFCLYNLGPDLDISCWSSYVNLLCKFSNSNMVYSEWKLHQQRHGLSLKAFNDTIQSLIKLEDSERAWTLAYESEDVGSSIRQDTWECLLTYPQYIRQWIPEMNGPALRMLEREVCKVESRLGFRWEGAQDGYHRAATSQQLFISAGLEKS